MAVKEDLRSMIMSFRVAELQSFLEYAGEKNIRLRKKELQKKALKLTTKKRLAKKIKSLYKSMMGNSSEDDAFVPSDLDDCYDDLKNYFDENQYPDYDYLNNCGNSYSNGYFTQQFAMFTKNLDLKRLHNIQFRNLPFFEYKNDILTITPLIPKKQRDDPFTFETTFKLSQETSNAIFSEGSRYHALLRFCVLNNEMEVNDELPSVLWVKVNHYECSLPSTISGGSKQSLSKRSAPIDITSNLEEKRKYTNSISIQWVDHYTSYGIIIQLMKKCTSEDLITKLKAKGERDASISKKFIYDSLNDDDDGEISATTLKMSLICPIGKMPITLPTRATTCNHLQCFDGCSYIQINELKSTWICPVCSQTCLYENLFVDGYFTEILRSDKFLPNIRDVELDPDGSWRPVPHKEKSERPCRNLATVPDDIPKEKFGTSVESKNNSIDSDMIDELKHFFFNYDSSNLESGVSTENRSTLNVNLPAMPILSQDDLAGLSHRETDENAMLNESSATNSKNDLPKKKDVLLVDLTMSDSDTDDDIKSASSPSYTWSPSEHFLKYDLHSPSPKSPPVYNIDSDSNSSF